MIPPWCWRLLLSASSVIWAISASAVFAAELRFAENLIADRYQYCYGVAAADLDGDGDVDLTNGDTTGNTFYWFENDGRGKFSRHTIQEAETGWFERHAIGDLNGDKKPDVVVVKNLDGHLVWFENSGQPARDNSWKRHLLSTDIKRAYDVAIVDLNGDGWNDVAASAYSGNYLAWFENPGSTGQREWKKEIIDSQLLEARTVRMADFNRDGRPDILGTGLAGNMTAWYERTKDASAPWKRHVVDDHSAKPVHGEPVDLDQDGDQDIVMACGMSAAAEAANSHYVVWYENSSQPGSTVSWKKHEVSRLPYAFEVVSADLDNDGDRDLVATAWGGMGQIIWLENTGSPLGPWRQHDLKTPWAHANQPLVVDLDRDGRLDVVATAEHGSNELRWWRNAGP